MDLQIRDALPGDAPAIALLDREAMGYDFPVEKTRKQLRKLLADGRDKILVAQDGEQVIGYVHLTDYDLLYQEPMKNVMGIAVASGFRHMGVGRALLAAAEAWAADTGASGIRLTSGEARTGAHDFYRALGYTQGKRQLNFSKRF